MGFDTHFIDQLRDSAPILDVVSDHVRLKKSGRNYVGLCPFHNEKTPSFNVSPSKQMYKCFGCNEGGDVFEFVMRVEGLSFPEAVRRLADRVGLPVPQESGGPTEQALERRNRLLGALDQAGGLFRKWLAGPDGGVARDYFADRGLSDQTIEAFGLGFAPAGSVLTAELTRAGFSVEELETCGLVKLGGGGDAYDKFRSRVMFPIRDLTGRTIAFGGRAFGEARPKYLNSPETPIYHKARNLYGLDVSRDQIRRRDFAILVEGYFDCIVPWQFGFGNVVASLGTALTADQVKLLGRYTRRVVVNFDPDSAGLAAAQRSIDLFLKAGFQINVVQLPGGRDPDTFLREEGADSYGALLRESDPFIDFLVRRAQSRHQDPFSPRAKQEAVDELLPYLNRVPNRVEKAEYVSQVARRLQVDEALLVRELRRMARPRAEPARIVRQMEATPAERHVLAAVCDDAHRPGVLAALSPDLFAGLRTETIFEKIFELAKRNVSWSVLMLREALSPEDLDFLERVVFGAEVLSGDVIERSIDALRRLADDRRSRQIQEEIEALRDSEQSEEMLRRIDELLQEKASLRKRREQGAPTA